MKHSFAVICATSLILACSVMTVTWSAKELSSSQHSFAESVVTREGKARLLIGLLNAETSQRGYLLTGRTDYLAPYFAAIESIQTEMQVFDDRDFDEHQREFVNTMKPQIAIKLDELRRTIYMMRTEGPKKALAMLQKDDGKMSMENLRAQIIADKDYTVPLRAKWAAQSEMMASIVLFGGLAAILSLMVLVGTVVQRNFELAKLVKPERETKAFSTFTF